MRGLDAENTAAVGEIVTAPAYLVEMAFSTTVRMTGGAAKAWGGFTFASADIRVRLGGGTPVVDIFNEGGALGALVLADGTAGRAINIWQAYATASVVPGAPTGYTAPVLIFSGEMSTADIGDTISIACKQSPPRMTPRTMMAPPVFNALPAAGTRIQMPAQVIILE